MAPSNGASVNLYVAIYPQGPFFKHWALFVDDPAHYLMFHAQGTDGNFHFEERENNPRDSVTDPELVLVTKILKGNIPYLQTCARNQPMNRGHGWNCQSYVVELIEKANDERIIKVKAAKVEAIQEMMEGFD